MCTGWPAHVRTLTRRELSWRQEGDLILSPYTPHPLPPTPTTASASPSALQGRCKNNLPLVTVDARLVLRGACVFAPAPHTRLLIRENTRLHLEAFSTKRSRQLAALGCYNRDDYQGFIPCVCVIVCVCDDEYVKGSL